MSAQVLSILNAIAELDAEQKRELRAMLAADTVLDFPPSEEDRIARLTALWGSHRSDSTSVDDFIRRKQDEIDLEDRRWTD